MKAARYGTYGGPDVITIDEVESPTPKEGQVLVEVCAAALNPFDYKLRSGAMKDTITLDFPVTAAADFSGIISQVADGVSGFRPGDAVYGSANILGGGSGALAEQVAANAANIARKPAALTHAEAAALVLVGVSALQAIDQLNLGAGDKILIHGGAGGIGSAAIQYAKHLGAHVATTARAEDVEFVRTLGADEVIDYEQERFEDKLHDFDAVFDTIGGDTYTRSLAVLKPDGTIISMVQDPDEDLASRHKVKALKQNTKVTTDSLDRLSGLVDAGAISPKIDKEFPLSQAAEAFTHLETGHPRGKVVVIVKS